MTSTKLMKNSTLLKVHGKSKLYDKRSLYLFRTENFLRKRIIWLIEWK
jgi:hypothetical protein